MSDNVARPITIDPAALSARQRAAYDAIRSGPRGDVPGPLKLWLISPDLAERAQSLGAFCRFGTSLSADLSELAILVTGAFWRAGYEWHVHAPIAERAGVKAAAIEAIRTGVTPDLTGNQEIVYRFCRALLEQHDVDDDTYAAAVRALGVTGVVELVGVLGYYGLISMTIRAFRIPVPNDASDPFAQGQTG